jgi:hypothetical protein
MRWLRSLSAKLFPAWHERRLLRQLRARNAVGLAALKDLIKTVEMKERASKVDDRTPGTRKPDPDRAPPSSSSPPRDCHEWPSQHAKGNPNAQTRPTNKPVRGA